MPTIIPNITLYDSVTNYYSMMMFQLILYILLCYLSIPYLILLKTIILSHIFPTINLYVSDM